MKTEIISLSTYIYSVLSSFTEGTIHSVYKKTINIQVGTFLLALQARSTPQSPLSMITAFSERELTCLNIAAGQNVKITPSALILLPETDPVFFFYKNASVFDSFLSPGPVTFYDFLYTAIQQSSATGFRRIFVPSSDPLPGDQTLINKAAVQKLSAAAASFHKQDYIACASQLSGLIGLGIGLTPSGDDFLCGVLAGMILLNKEDHPLSSFLKSELQTHLENTNDISRSFLVCALSSHFSRPVKELPMLSSYPEVLSSFEAIGHSSGIDTLCGIFFICSLLLCKHPLLQPPLRL